MIKNKLVFLRIEAHDCNFQVTANDMKVRFETQGNPLTVEYPVNEFFTSGQLKVKAFLSPLAGQTFLSEEAACHLSIVQTIDGEKGSRSLIKEYKSPTVQANSRNELSHTFEYADKDLSFEFQLMQGMQIPNSAALERELKSRYIEFYKALSEKNIDDVLKQTKLRDEEYALAYYISYSSRMHDIRETLQEYLEDGNMQLLKLDFSGYKIRFYYGNRICCLEDEDGDSPIVFLNNVADTVTLLPLYYGRFLSGELQLIR